MIRIEREAWAAAAAHAEQAYPNECCGVLLGGRAGDTVSAQRALPLANAYDGPQGDRFEIAPADLLRAEREARAAGLDIVAIFHSHPDCDAYFSATDLRHCAPWYVHVVVSVKGGRIDHARAYQPDLDQTAAVEVELALPLVDR